MALESFCHLFNSGRQTFPHLLIYDPRITIEGALRATVDSKLKDEDAPSEANYATVGLRHRVICNLMLLIPYSVKCLCHAYRPFPFAYPLLAFAITDTRPSPDCATLAYYESAQLKESGPFQLCRQLQE